MKAIDNVSIALKPNVYNTFRNLVNTVPNTLGEYVDNAVQSFITHKDEIRKVEPDYKLVVEITIDFESRIIEIKDNGAGIDSENYIRAFEPAHIPLDDTGLNEFGMGMKTASVWLSNNWSVRTKAFGENVERYTEFNLEKVTREEREVLEVIEQAAPRYQHYTTIVLSQLSKNAPKIGQMEKIKRHLSSIYRAFLRSGEVSIFVNGISLEAPNYGILDAPFYKTPDGESKVWKKEIDYQWGEYRIKGFVAILDKMQNGANGLVLMRRGRVIVGGGDERYFPAVIFGQSGSFRYRRLFGEFEVEGFDVTFNKNGFREEDDLYFLMEAIRNELKAGELNILAQTDNYRQRSKEQFSKISKDIKKDLERQSRPRQLTRQVTEVESKVNNAQYIKRTEETILNAKPLETYTESFSFDDKDYSLKIELVTESDTDALYTVGYENSNHKSDDEIIGIICKINLAHPFFTRFDQFKRAQNYNPIISIFKSLALAEIMAPSKGTKQGAMIRILFNQHILN